MYIDQLLPFQKDGVKFLTRKRNTLLADEAGLGKTIQTIKALERLNARKVLIVCPSTVKAYWKQELEKYLDWSPIIQLLSTQKDKVSLKSNIIITSFALLSFQYSEIVKQKYAVCVCDEAHKLKTPEAIRTQTMLNPEKGIINFCAFRIFLTGTPIETKPIDIFTTIKALRPDLLGTYSTYETFAFRYCNAYKNPFGTLLFGKPPERRVLELRNILSKFMLRRTRNQKDIKVIVENIPVPLTAAIKAIQEEEQVRIDALLSNSFNLSEYAELSIKAGTWQETALAKLDFCIEFLKDRLETTNKLVIFAYHRSVIKRLALALKTYSPVTFTGGNSAKAKEQAKTQFINNPEVKIFLGQIQAAGQAIDGLQYVCSDVIFLEVSQTPGDIVQATRRIARTGQKKTVLVQTLLVEDSIETRIFTSIKQKLEIIKNIVDQKEVKSGRSY